MKIQNFVHPVTTMFPGIGAFPLPHSPTTLFVRIGRTLQSFPPSKRSGRLSTHSAFQLGRMTLIGQIRLFDGEVHQQSNCRHLLSSLHLLAIIWFGLPWRSFTLSGPLQPDVWLLRRLRPPCRTLAFSRPTRWVMRCGSSPVPTPMPIATRSCLLYSEVTGG